MPTQAGNSASGGPSNSSRPGSSRNGRIWPPASRAVQTGGRSILDAVAGAIEGKGDQLSDSRAVLRDYGNMSSATVMFVLKRMLDRFRDTRMGGNGLGCAMAFGPGLTAESMLFRLAAA